MILLIFLFAISQTSAQKLYDNDVEKKIAKLGIELTTPSKPVANYVGAVRSGNLVFLSGKISKDKDGNFITGKLGTDLTVEQGYEAARTCQYQEHLN